MRLARVIDTVPAPPEQLVVLEIAVDAVTAAKLSLRAGLLGTSPEKWAAAIVTVAIRNSGARG